VRDVLQKSDQDATSGDRRGGYIITPKENQSFEQYYKVVLLWIASAATLSTIATAVFQFVFAGLISRVIPG